MGDWIRFALTWAVLSVVTIWACAEIWQLP